MSCIEKMGIQGIRSFGPDPADMQQIVFFTPLTLILGPNGTGKTTLIECLKYITTGDLPPGGKQNCAFIHDPKIANETEVRAKVMLRFRDVRGKQYSATRNLQATQKAKKIEMKTLDGTISYKDENTGEIRSIGSRCADMDREMVTLLGVAKPILDSVIFCHQEDANWPLGEGKALKTRFDDIFASTRYVKCLEVIRKTSKEQLAEISLHRNDIKFLRDHKDKAEQIQGNLAENQARLSACEENLDHIKNMIKPLSDKMEKIMNRGQEIYELQNQIQNFKTEISHFRREQDELKKNIKRDLQGSLSQIKDELQNFQSGVKEKEKLLRQRNLDVDSLVQELYDVSEEKATLLVEQGLLQDEMKRYQKTVANRDALICQLSNDYEIAGFTGNLTDGEVNKFIRILQSKEKELNDNLKRKMSLYEAKEQAFQAEIDDLRNTKTRLETELDMKRETLANNNCQIRSIKQELSAVGASASTLKTISSDLKMREQDLVEIERTTDFEMLKEEIRSLEAEKMKKDNQMKTLDEELSRLTRESTVRNQLDHFRKDKAMKMENSQKLKSKISDSMKHLLGHMPTDNLRRQLAQCQTKLREKIRNLEEKLQACRRKKTQYETQLKMQRDQLAAKEKELKSHQEKLREVSGQLDFNTGLERMQESLRNAQDKKGNLRGVQYMYRKYEESLSKDEHAPCPLCHRPFDQKREIDELILEIQQKMSLVPDKLERENTKINNYKQKVEEMIELRPVRSSIEDLEGNVLPNLKQQVLSLEKDISEIEMEVTEQEDDLDTLRSDDQMVQMVLSDAGMVDQYTIELRDLETNIKQLSGQLIGGDEDRTMQQVQEDREELQDAIRRISRKLDDTRKEHGEKSEKMNHLKGEINRLNARKLEIEKSLQNRARLEDDRAKLEAENTSLEQQVKDGEQEMRPLQENITTKQKQKQSISKQKEDDHKEALREVNDFCDNQKQVERYNSEIHDYVTKGKEEKLNGMSSEIKEIEQRAVKLSQMKDRLAKEIDEIKTDLARQQVQERELRDCLSIHEKEAQIQRKEEAIEKLQDQLGSLDTDNLMVEKRTIEEKLERLNREKQHAVVKQIDYTSKITMLQKELKDDMYKDADLKYRDKMIILRTTELANKDLENYYRALDRTIMSYHTQKMTEINKIIRELWRNTYKGNDIETIEIRSDEDETGAVSKKRQYNYRVVMIKNGVAIDMRNRCSAGQKVLASLIIRLALAETFCINCGILALDEPTTNLDRENIESLAVALVEIIKSRSKQRNFQLVVITHDEDFVDSLGRSEFVEDFFKVRKNEYGCTRLVKAKVTDLQTR